MRRLNTTMPATAKAQAIEDFRNIAQWQLALKILAVGSLLVLLSVSPSFAQMAPLMPTSPAMGTTSPLGVPGTTSSVGAVGIPLGATELSPGGVSPLLLGSTASTDPCAGSGISASGMNGTVSTFDGSGVATNTMGTSSASSCGGGTASGTTTTTAGLSGSNGGSAPGVAPVGAIPLDATELNSAGVSPMVTSPVLSSPCMTSLGGSTPAMASNSIGMTTTTGPSC